MQDWIVVAHVIGARGNRGEVSAEPLSRPERLLGLTEVTLRPGAGPSPEERIVEIEEAWEHRGRVILKFRGVDSISAAEQLAGLDVCIPRARRPDPPEGEYYHSDLVGCQVVDRSSGEVVGRVEEFQEIGQSGLLRVAGPDGSELLVPFARSICVRIDPAERRIEVELPEGLRELNRP
jgi:16S rRNA processing protein RimM